MSLLKSVMSVHTLHDMFVISAATLRDDRYAVPTVRPLALLVCRLSSLGINKHVPVAKIRETSGSYVECRSHAWDI